MSKSKKKMVATAKNKESAGIRSYLLAGDEGAAQGIVIIIVPSHKKNKERIDQEKQAKVVEKGMSLLANLFGGATQFNARGGVWKEEETGEILWDKPILMESYADADKLTTISVIDKIVGFAKQIGRDMEQDCVAVVLGDKMHFFSNYSGAPKAKLL